MAKRLFDLFVSAILLLLLFPLLLAVAAAVRAFLGSPVFFSQLRPGLNGQFFRLIKFRTMSSPVGDGERSHADDERLSTFGRILRRTSLDELPELVNVIKGDMSLVGPRPLLVEYLPLYSSGQRRRHEVRPGITGWAQVNGRNAVSWEEKFSLDIWYVDNQSLWLDLRILAMTLVQIFRTDQISQPGHATMDRFKGSAK